MNYRHQFHAGNFADVFKHSLLVSLLRALQRKEKGFLYLDTHAGRGGYDLEMTGQLPGGREREPEWPQGLGRVWRESHPALHDYLELARRFNQERGGGDDAPQFYPGSPWLAAVMARPQDRLALCELREDDAEALDLALGGRRKVSVQRIDGYTALRAMLPPPEKRALVLIDPPFENAGEFGDVLAGLREARRRLPDGVLAVWYPLTERARREEFLRDLVEPGLPPALTAELQIADEASPLRMKGCGLLVLNPPWQIEIEFRAVLAVLAEDLKLGERAAVRIEWLVREK